MLATANRELFNTAIGKVKQTYKRRKDGWLTDPICLLLFFIPLTQFIDVNVGGHLHGPDILLISLSLGLLVLGRSRVRDSQLAIFAGFLALWLVGAVVTDLYRSTPMSDIARGWSKIIVFGFDFATVFLLVKGRLSRLIAYSAGLALGQVINTYFFPNDAVAGGEVWKFGYGATVTLGFFILSALNVKSKVLQRLLFLAPFAAASLNLYNDSRAAFLTAISAAALGYLSIAFRRVRLSAAGLAVIALSIVGAAWLASSSYQYLAHQGVLGDKARDKLEFQSQGTLPLIFAGRTEIFGSTQAIIDSPILGHGSWAKDTHYVDIMYERLMDAGFDLKDLSYYGGEQIPSHSHLLGAWVEAGILGAVFWFYVLALASLALYRKFFSPGRDTFFVMFLLFELIWSIFFSPFGEERRFSDPMNIVAAMIILTPHSRRRHAAKSDSSIYDGSQFYKHNRPTSLSSTC